MNIDPESIPVSQDQVAAVTVRLIQGIVRRSFHVAVDDVDAVIRQAQRLVDECEPEMKPLYQRALRQVEAYRTFRLELERLRPKE